jgi:hypothetical protein
VRAFLDGWTWPHSIEARGSGTCPPLLQPRNRPLRRRRRRCCIWERAAGAHGQSLTTHHPDRAERREGGDAETITAAVIITKELIRAGAAGAGNKNKTIPLGSRHHPPRMIIQRAGRQTSNNSRTELRRADGNPPPHRALWSTHTALMHDAE